MCQEWVVIIKNICHPVDLEAVPLVLKEIREHLWIEYSKVRQGRKLLFFNRHAAGMDFLSLKNAEEAGCCIQTLDGRGSDGHQSTAHAAGGITEYQVEETPGKRGSWGEREISKDYVCLCDWKWFIPLCVVIYQVRQSGRRLHHGKGCCVTIVVLLLVSGNHKKSILVLF